MASLETFRISSSKCSAKDVIISSSAGIKRWQERRPALCNPTEMIVSQDFREKSEKCLNERRKRIGKKLSFFVKSALFTSYDVDLI